MYLKMSIYQVAHQCTAVSCLQIELRLSRDCVFCGRRAVMMKIKFQPGEMEINIFCNLFTDAIELFKWSNVIMGRPSLNMLRVAMVLFNNSDVTC